MRISSQSDLKRLVKIVIDYNIVTNIYSRNGSYYDEPKIYSFAGRLNIGNSENNYKEDQFGTGSSFSKTKALIKCLGESVERFVLSKCDDYHLIWDSYYNLKEKAINPENFVSFSTFKTKPTFVIYSNDRQKMNWIKGRSLVSSKEVFVPAQLVFIPYKFRKNEPTLRFPTTTGGAVYNSLDGAITNGLLEVIERDAFIINYLNKLSRNVIDLSHSVDKTLRRIVDYTKRYNLDVYIVDISTDVPVYTIMTVIVDETGKGPAVSIGVKSTFNLKDAIIGSVEEALHIRPWLRGLMIKQSDKITQIEKGRNYVITTEERGRLWINSKSINKIKFFLKGKRISIEKMPESKSRNFVSLLKWFKKNKEDVLYIDLNLPSFKRDSK